MPEIGFGCDAIRAHIIQWGQEKNRRITYGYDYEVEHKPAKRARISVNRSATLTSCLDSSDSDTDHESSPSNSLQDLSQQSGKVATLVSFNAACLQDLGVKTHLIPIAKRLGVKFRSLGKRALLIPIARQLFEQGVLKVECADVDYKHLKRSQIDLLIQA